MKYTREQRLDIGRQIYNGEITKFQAAEKYNISICKCQYKNVHKVANKNAQLST
jgi:transposase